MLSPLALSAASCDWMLLARGGTRQLRLSRYGCRIFKVEGHYQLANNMHAPAPSGQAAFPFVALGGEAWAVIKES